MVAATAQVHGLFMRAYLHVSIDLKSAYILVGSTYSNFHLGWTLQMVLQVGTWSRQSITKATY